MKSYIVSNSKILGGKPIIVGTRVPVARIIYLLKEGYTLENIADQYPHISIDILNKVIDEIVEKIDTNSNVPQVS